MNIKTVLPITILLLSANYLCSWSYDGGQESRFARNDSVRIAASHQYSKMNPIKYVFLGKNYREDWEQSVQMPVFHIATYKGGFEIEKMGGGQQTKSLHLKDKKGIGWVLRTVDKDVTNALPPSIRNTFIKNIVQDQISAAYPYAPLTITDIARHIGVPTDTAALFYVPDDTALGQFRPYFANTVCFLRRKNLTVDRSDMYDTEEIKAKLLSGSTFQIMQEQVLRARLLDMLIGDWDRHDKQWEWGIRDSMAIKYVYPIPEDRDQAYFLAEGFLPKVIKTVALPHLVGFKSSLKSLKDLNNKAYGFDRFFLSGLDAQDWQRIITEVQSALSDDVIRAAVSKLPAEVYAISGHEVTNKLLKRKEQLYRYGMDYYRFIASEAVIPLTREKDIISITEEPRKSVEISIASADGKLWFNRKFLRKETRIIRILHSGDEDQVSKSGADQKSGIKILFEQRAADTATVAAQRT